MSIFREKPAFYYTAVGLLVLTLISFTSHYDASGVEKFSCLRTSDWSF